MPSVSANRQRDHPIRRVRMDSAAPVLVLYWFGRRIRIVSPIFAPVLAKESSYCRDTVRVNRRLLWRIASARARSGSVREEYLPFLRSP